MRRTKWMLIAVAAVLGGVGSGQQPAEEAFAVRIGLIMPSEGANAAVQEAADQGLQMAVDELGFNANLLGFDLSIAVEVADGPEEAAEAARGLLEGQPLAIAGGYGEGVAAAISEVLSAEQVPFLNIGSPAISLRNEQCSEWMFHIEPSGGMYLDALAGWYVGAGFRDWHMIVDESPESEALADRLERTLRERHFGAEVTGRSVISGEPATLEAALDAGVRADVIVMMPRAERQLELLAVAEEMGLETDLTGFPWPETQTREYYSEAVAAAPSRLAHRASAWEPTLDAYGARELNARFAARFGELMDTPAWATYQAVKLVFEAVSFGGVRDTAALRAHLAADDAVFDVWKGIGVTFRPWNHQLRQTLFLVELVPGAEGERELALLVGELPAIYLPRTDPVERLDQLGDLAESTRCDF